MTYQVVATSESGDTYTEQFDSKPTPEELSTWAHNTDGYFNQGYASKQEQIDARDVGPGYDGSFVHIDSIEKIS